MATIKYLVRGKVKGKLSQISLRFRDGQEVDFVVDSGYKADPAVWSNKTHTLKQRIETSSANDLRDKLDKLRDYLIERYNGRNKSSGPPSRNWLNSIITEYHKEKLEYLNLNQYIDHFISGAESGEILYEHNGVKGKYNPSTIKNYKGFQAQFNLYQEEKGYLDYEDVTMDFYKAFTDWFIKKNYSVNTIGRHVKNLKVIMRLARNDKMHNNTEIENKTFRSWKEDVFNVYLTEREVQKIFEVDLSDREPVWTKIRDVFIVGCEIAQRVSDYKRISKEHIRERDGRKYIEIFQKKGIGSKKVIIPVSPRLDYILKKYDYNLPKIHEQKLNEKIKLIAKDLKIAELVTYEKMIGGKKTSISKPKYQMITSHTCRRTGATLMYRAGIPVRDCMAITGHTTERMFLNYVKTGIEETAEDLSRYDHFNKPLLRKAE